MKVEVIVALIAGAVALASAAMAWRNSTHSDKNTRAIAQLQIDNEKVRANAQLRKEISSYSEPLARAAYELQSRLYNILDQDFLEFYLVKGDDREQVYAVNNTAFLIGQYLCWTELARSEIQFIDLGESTKTRVLSTLQDSISRSWGTDAYPRILRIFAGEQRAIGEVLTQAGADPLGCMGYGTFLKKFKPGTDLLIDAVRADISSLGVALEPAETRLTTLQHQLIDLLNLLDSDYLRFPKTRRSKVKASKALSIS